MSVVIVSGPTQVIRAGQMRTAVVSRTSAIARSAPRSIWPAGPASGGAGEPRTASDPRSAFATAPVRVRRHDDDRQRAAGPGEIRKPSDARLPERVGDGALGRGREDDGGDGHAWPMCR